MLPKHLLGSYLRYKDDTDHVATCLATTSQRCGFVPKKLKGRARTLRKRAAKEGTTTRKPTTYTVPLNEFLPMAQHIAALDGHRARLPDMFFEALNRAIRLREKVGFAYHHTEDEESNQQSTFNHCRFTMELKKVLQTLAHLMPTAEPDSRGQLSNRFCNLELEEPHEVDESTSNSAPISAPTATPAAQGTEATYKAEIITDRGEAFIALQCLLADCHLFRTILLETCNMYSLEQDQYPTFAEHGGVTELLLTHYTSVCKSRGLDPLQMENPEDPFNFATYDIAEELFLPTWRLLAEFMGNQTGPPRTRDPSADRSKMLPRERYNEDAFILMDILQDIRTLRKNGRAIVNEEFTRGLHEAFQTGEIPLSLCLAAQALLDLHHVLRGEEERPHAELCKIARAIETSIDENLEFHKITKATCWSVDKYDTLIKLLGVVRKTGEKEQTEPVRIVERRLLKKLHITCGLNAYYMKAIFYEEGIKFSEASRLCFVTAHLYNALQQERLISKPWTDMEFIIDHQDRRHLFVGGTPSKPDEYLTRLSLASGFSISNSSSNQRNTEHLKFLRTKRRHLEGSAHVSLFFKQKYCHDADTTIMTKDDMERIVDMCQWHEAEQEDVPRGSGLLRYRRRPSTKPHVKSGRNGRPRRTVLELLRSLRTSLLAESIEFSFDFLRMHRICWGLLHGIRTATEDRIPPGLRHTSLERADGIYNIVAAIFMTVSPDESIAKLLGVSYSRSHARTSPRDLLEKAADVLNRNLDEVSQNRSGPGGEVFDIMLDLLGLQSETEGPTMYISPIGLHELPCHQSRGDWGEAPLSLTKLGEGKTIV
nr:hypothetical protein LTR18_011149 [Exophiala xenobiotica]